MCRKYNTFFTCSHKCVHLNFAAFLKSGEIEFMRKNCYSMSTFFIKKFTQRCALPRYNAFKKNLFVIILFRCVNYLGQFGYTYTFRYFFPVTFSGFATADKG